MLEVLCIFSRKYLPKLIHSLRPSLFWCRERAKACASHLVVCLTVAASSLINFDGDDPPLSAPRIQRELLYFEQLELIRITSQRVTPLVSCFADICFLLSVSNLVYYTVSIKMWMKNPCSITISPARLVDESHSPVPKAGPLRPSMNSWKCWATK